MATMKRPKRDAGKAHVGTGKAAPTLDAVVERICALAQMDETELAVALGTPRGASLTSLDLVGTRTPVKPQSHLKAWADIHPADPRELTTEQYLRWMQGSDTTGTAVDAPAPLALYGAHLDKKA